MYASYKPGTSTLRTLTADDIAGACEIYPTAAERTVDGLWSRIGALLPAFTPQECANFFAAAGYEPD